MEALLACICFKVVKFGLKFCKLKPAMLMPATCVGAPLYIIKSMHVGSPADVIPLMLLIPFGRYYGMVFGALQQDLASMREEKWRFAIIDHSDFWSLWEHEPFMSWTSRRPQLALGTCRS